MSFRSLKVVIPGYGETRLGASAAGLLRVEEEHRWRRARSIGIVGTVLLHVLVLLLTRSIAVEPLANTAAAGPPSGDLRAAAGGGSGLTMVEVRPEQAPVEEEVPTPIPVPVEVVIPEEVVEVERTPEPSVEIAPPSLPGTGGPGTGGQDGPTAGPGTATGAGAGAGGGGTADTGTSRVVPPTPRGIFIPPPGRPASARGLEITAFLFVNESGRVDRRQVRLEPPTSDSRYNQRLVQSLSEWVFEPARQAGRPVSTWYSVQISL